MLKATDIIPILDVHFSDVDQIGNWRRYTANGRRLCVDIERKTVPPLVIEPDLVQRLDGTPLAGVVVRDMYHNTNLKGFPKRQNRGREPIQYGYRINLATAESLLSLLDVIDGKLIDPQLQMPDPESDPTKATQILATVKQRVGQRAFREDLDERWESACAVTGLNVRILLRASHIKPWYLSDDAERLTSDNGLLLNVLLDAAFDAGLLTFADNGEAILADIPGCDLWRSLGLSHGARLRKPLSDREREFLCYHRQRRFIGSRQRVE